MNKAAELLSLFLSVPTIVLCAGVVVLWFSATWSAWTQKERLTAQDWLISGVFVGFCGEAMDNLYWLFPWTASFLHLEITDTLFAHGMYPNILFRQIAGAVAAYCHIRAHFEFKTDPTRKHDSILGYSILGGMMYAGFLIFARG